MTSFLPSDRSKQKKKKQKPLTRASLDIKIDDSSKHDKRKYFVTCAVAGAEVDAAFFESIQGYCKEKNAKLVILPMRGVYKRDSGYDTSLRPYLSTEYIFNSNLQAQDFMISPQMINPLTGLNRFGQKEYSLIIASPKQFMRVVPVSHEAFPHIIHSTGTCTLPQYATTRQGCLARQDHCLGGLIVEIEDKATFYIRQVQADSHKGFYDLGEYFFHSTTEKRRASAFVMGDLHSGFEDETACNSWVECLETVTPKYIIIHDLFDGHSISHHHKNDIERQVNREPHLDTLEKELQQVVKSLTFWASRFPKSEIIVVPSNHDEFINRYLTEVRYADDRFNHKIAITLAKWFLAGCNPLQKYVESTTSLSNVKWLKREKDYKLYKAHIGAHGDRGSNGKKGMALSEAELAYGNAIIGHSHSPGILRNIFQVGTSTRLWLDYNKGNPSSWLHCSCIMYKGGTRQLIISIKGNWRLD